MNDRILSLLGLCRRAGKMSLGNDAVIASIANGEARLVICAADIAENTRKKIALAARESSVPCLTLNRTKDNLGNAIGKYCAVISVNDSGFAKKLVGYIQSESEE